MVSTVRFWPPPWPPPPNPARCTPSTCWPAAFLLAALPAAPAPPEAVAPLAPPVAPAPVLAVVVPPAPPLGPLGPGAPGLDMAERVFEVRVPERMREYWYASAAMSETYFWQMSEIRRTRGSGVVSSSTSGAAAGPAVVPFEGREAVAVEGPAVVPLLASEVVDWLVWELREERGGGLSPASVRAWKTTASGIWGVVSELKLCKRSFKGGCKQLEWGAVSYEERHWARARQSEAQ